MRILPILVMLFLLSSSFCYGQYWGERVMEKSFEEADFFFQPAFLNPYGIGGFGSAALGIIDNPLLNLHLNPALLSAHPLPPHHLYLNFRNDVTIKDRDSYYIYPMYDSRVSSSSDRAMSWYPSYFTASTRKAVEPVFAAAYILRPFKGRSNYTFGLTCQVIYQDERYYEIPQNIYRSQVGLDYAGNKVADENSIPVIDRYSGQDEMHQQGYFLSLFNSATVTPWLDLGLRLSRVGYQRDGSFGSANLWDNNSYYYYSSDRNYMKNREQAYGHWDLLAGMMVRPNAEMKIGLSLGILDGEVTQALDEVDNSDYIYGDRAQDKNWGIYERQYYETQSWSHKGSTVYGGVYFQERLRPSMTFSASYRLTKENLDIGLASSLLDTSYSQYANEWDDTYNNRIYNYESESNYHLRDDREGGGELTGVKHQMTAALQWRMDEKTRLDFGIHWTGKRRETISSEQVIANRFNTYWWKNNDQESNYDDATFEDKDLKWNFTTQVMTLQIPMFLTRRLTDRFELTFGLNRKMTHWVIEDVTEAWYRLKVETINGVTKTRGPVIERYTQPKEIRTDIETGALFGLTIKPADKFDIRLLVVPTYIKTYQGTELDDLQWWIDFNMFL